MNYLIFDVETTNNLDDPLVYDCGWTIINEKGKILLTRSLVNSDIFLNSKLMDYAYFKEKIPLYNKQIKNGSRKLFSFEKIRRTLERDYNKFHCKALVAHNAKFDYLACQTTFRFLTKSEKRYFFPFNTEFYDSLKMAKQTFGKNSEYRKYCLENGYMTSTNQPRLTAEVLYRYINKNENFNESHTGLEDTLIEKEIFLTCLRLNPNVDCYCFSKSPKRT